MVKYIQISKALNRAKFETGSAILRTVESGNPTMVYALEHKSEGPRTVRMRFNPYGHEDPAIELQSYYIAGDVRRPLRGNRIPEVFHRHNARILSSVKSLPDIWFTSDWIVNAKVKHIIESFEPGQHQFVPLNLRDKNDQPIEREELCLIMGDGT